MAHRAPGALLRLEGNMPEITRRRVGELLRGVFRILSDAPDGMRAQEVLSRLQREVVPTEFEKSDYPNRPGVRRYEKIVRFATVGPVKAGWMVKSKGRWSLTNQGRTALEAFPDPEAFCRESDRLYRVWISGRPEDQREMEVEEAVEQPVPGSAFEEAQDTAWDEIEGHLSKIGPYDFQQLVAGLLRAMGYHVSWIAPPGPDQGIDILACGDALGVREPCIKVAVRRRAEKADVKDIREFVSLVHPTDVGIFVSLGGFTKPAEEFARAEQRKLRLLDLEKLFDLWVEHYRRISDDEQQLLPLKPVWFLAPKES